MKKHIKIIILMLTLLVGYNKVNALEYVSDISFNKQMVGTAQTVKLDITGDTDAAKLKAIRYRFEVTCDTDYCLVSLPYSMTTQIEEKPNFEEEITTREYQFINNFAVQISSIDNKYYVCSIGKSTIDCMVANHTNTNWIEFKYTGNTLIDDSYSKIDIPNIINIYNVNNAAHIKQEIERVEETLNQDKNFNQDIEEIKDKDKIDQQIQKNEEVMNKIDLSGADTVQVTVNPNATRFIWDIVDNIRESSQKIILMITSVLGLGIIKMILNR